jgi:hypothetical protein
LCLVLLTPLALLALAAQPREHSRCVGLRLLGRLPAPGATRWRIRARLPFQLPAPGAARWRIRARLPFRLPALRWRGPALVERQLALLLLRPLRLIPAIGGPAIRWLIACASLVLCPSSLAAGGRCGSAVRRALVGALLGALALVVGALV